MRAWPPVPPPPSGELIYPLDPVDLRPEDDETTEGRGGEREREHDGGRVRQF